MADHLNILERDNGEGDVVLSAPELEYSGTAAENVINHVVIVIAMMQLMQISDNNEMLQRNVVNDGNGENSQLDPEHAIPTSELLPRNIVEDPSHTKPRDGTFKFLKMYALGQAGILAAASSASRRMGWSLFMLSGLVSTATSVVLMIKLYQQLKQVREEEYCRWVAEKAAIVVMLMAFSACLLFSFTP